LKISEEGTGIKSSTRAWSTLVSDATTREVARCGRGGGGTAFTVCVAVAVSREDEFDERVVEEAEGGGRMKSEALSLTNSFGRG
jgi:hypothetical protein